MKTHRLYKFVFGVRLIDQGENVFFKLLNDLTQHSIISQEISTQELGNISVNLLIKDICLVFYYIRFNLF